MKSHHPVLTGLLGLVPLVLIVLSGGVAAGVALAAGLPDGLAMLCWVVGAVGGFFLSRVILRRSFGDGTA